MEGFTGRQFGTIEDALAYPFLTLYILSSR